MRSTLLKGHERDLNSAIYVPELDRADGALECRRGSEGRANKNVPTARRTEER